VALHRKIGSVHKETDVPCHGTRPNRRNKAPILSIWENAMRKVLRGYAKDKDGNPILIGTMPVPHSKDKPSPRERKDKRHLVGQGATIFKREIVG
jgi:hypothetical protein